MPESSTILSKWGDKPATTTRPFQNCSSRTRPRINPMPELSIKGTWEKSRRRQAGFTFWAVSSYGLPHFPGGVVINFSGEAGCEHRLLYS